MTLFLKYSSRKGKVTQIRCDPVPFCIKHEAQVDLLKLVVWGQIVAKPQHSFQVLTSLTDRKRITLSPLQLDRLVGNTDNLYFVLDGGSLIHRVVWPKQETFGDFYTIYMSYIERHYGDEVTVVFDGYTESSVNTK
ncbi:hypothetical protein AVEN_3162-1, partial [Araneus ventricosus]